jgi:hypothetical protein
MEIDEALFGGHREVEPGKVSIEWDILKREIFPNGKQIFMRNKKALEETSI